MSILEAEAMPATRQRLPGNAQGETAHVFGDGLLGVIHHDTGHAVQDTAVILFNAGMVQRSGPHRGSVLLARALADKGFAVLRFDQSGLGDSPVATAASANRRHAELSAAIDLLAAQTGARRFVIGGICSAADNAFRLAAVEPRVHGLLLLDGLAYRTPGYWWRYLLPRIFHPGKVWRWWRARGTQTDMANFRDFPTREEAVAQMDDMVARDLRMLFVFTGGAYRYFNHAGQLSGALGPAARAPQVSLAYWRDCDHTFYLQRDRMRLQDTVAAWLEREFGTGTRDSLRLILHPAAR
jgi:pimeloyl-ACP methyl ester carboxylesterase